MRVSAFVDGFNLYHSLKALRDNRLKWLDLWALCNQLTRPKSERLTAVYYFSAYATWLPTQAQRHAAYVAALSARGVTPIMGNFKRKDRHCRQCGARWTGHEEKETDVNIALSLLKEAVDDTYDTALVVTRDSDIAPAVRMVRQRFPLKEIVVVAPPNAGHSTELIQAATRKAKINVQQVQRALLPQSVLRSDGSVVALRPTKYDTP